MVFRPIAPTTVFIAKPFEISYADAMHTSRLQYAPVLRRMKVDGTARNWRTLQALVDLCG